ncbi:MAG: hypothetical protein ACRC8A_02125 [Microcoleaceae cyanobacterium]
MQQLPEDIEIRFFRFMYGEEPISEFEQWVYATSTLEETLGDEDYFNLISLDFAKRGSQYKLIKILERHIDAGEYETWKLKNLLNLFLSQKGDLPLMLCEFYELYCDRFSFLDTLGLGYGLAIRVPPNGYSSEYWQELTDKEKESLLDSILPDAIDEARKVLTWLDEGKIVITDEQDELGRYLYLDKRSENEKDPNWQRVQTLSNNSKSGSWWKFWQ